MEETETFSDRVTHLLERLGFTHCFLVPGGAIMHLVNSARSQMTCVPFVHEAAAVIAAEYFNQVNPEARAYALVTSGPGVTNALTALAGAYLESRSVLVLAGQVKTQDLSHGEVRQKGIQEIDGTAMARPVALVSVRLEESASEAELLGLIGQGMTDRQGPVFIEICLDVQGAAVGVTHGEEVTVPDVSEDFVASVHETTNRIFGHLRKASRPIILIGGGVSHRTAMDCADGLSRLGVPVMTTWNGFDRVADDHPLFAGRPNTWGQRHANILLAQSDCIVALGTRLGLQQTGFNWEQWGPREGTGLVIQVDLDPAELQKGHPRIDVPLLSDADSVLRELSSRKLGAYSDWIGYIHFVKNRVPIIDPANVTGPGYVSPYHLVDQLAELLRPEDVIVPASSGSGQFVPMETFRLRKGQRVITNKGLASMGYGLAGAIGSALGSGSRVVLVEGDGSFSQSIQELGTLALNGWPVKIFLLDNDGYASIRTTQRNYFGGAYVGCDSATGLGFPDWILLARAFGIPAMTVGVEELGSQEFCRLMDTPGPAIFVVGVDPEQTYFPKVSSKLAKDGSMVSNPIHLMSPDLSLEVAAEVFRFRPDAVGGG